MHNLGFIINEKTLIGNILFREALIAFLPTYHSLRSLPCLPILPTHQRLTSITWKNTRKGLKLLESHCVIKSQVNILLIIPTWLKITSWTVISHFTLLEITSWTVIRHFTWLEITSWTVIRNFTWLEIWFVLTVPLSWKLVTYKIVYHWCLLKKIVPLSWQAKKWI